MINHPLFRPLVGAPSVVIDVLRPPPGPDVRTFYPDGSVDSFAKIDATPPRGAAAYFAGWRGRPIRNFVGEGSLLTVQFLEDRKVKGSLPPAVRETLADFFRAWIETPVSRQLHLDQLKLFLDSLRELILHDRTWLRLLTKTIRMFLDGDSQVPRGRITLTVNGAARFLRKYRGKFEIEGSPFPFYFMNFRNSSLFSRLANELIRAKNAKVVFLSSGRYPKIVEKKPVRPFRGTISYRGLPASHFLAGPLSGWGVLDLNLSHDEIVDQVVAVFCEIEKELDLNGNGMMERWGHTGYYQVRRGLQAIPVYPFLTDDALDHLGLTPQRREQLRHWEALLALVTMAELRKSPPGPYARLTRILLYWGHRSGLSNEEIVRRFRREGIIGVDFYRLKIGETVPRDPQFLHTLTEVLCVPDSLRLPLVENFWREYKILREGT